MWQFEKPNVPPKLLPDTILGICYVFPTQDIIRLSADLALKIRPLEVLFFGA
jgi:hypothetical protein